ncbi:D-alanyl-D-alanine carboxypeptidase family protein [Niallia sp. NCCP-28]|uniref:M15 family metallopeptidase n=1 Tax=Niallia sp. NCCP-28 TaxID=2934712 RepID=UPI00208C8877|nr:M15 family metallopeptidase [Niallia sp. NCCP-28]GKU80868.1 putative carboxypeptidase YodJ [Niallia sp. NCCP-28]
MKKVAALSFLAVLLLSGCKSLDDLEKNIPFLHSDEENTAEKEKPEKKEINTSGTESKETKEKSSEQETSPFTLEADYFNEIKVVDGRNIIQNPTNTVSLVNKEYGLPDGYAPEDLVRPNVAFSFGDQDIEKSYMRKAAAEALEKMFAQAKKEGVILYAVSGYRSYDRQTVLFDAEVKRVGEEKAIQAVAYPGNSEHQTGLAMDISSESSDFLLSDDFGKTAEGKWLEDNAHHFGFILRYPEGKDKITGYKFEPWHFRYVGEKSAKDIYDNDWTLEEYFQIVKKI